MRKQIDQLIDSWRDEMVRDVMEMVRIPSVSGNLGEIRRALDWVLDKGRRMGFETYTTRDGDVGVIEMGEGKEAIGILVHVDVVGPGDPDKWTRDPFDCYEKDGYLWGRGTIDDKGPVIMGLYAMVCLRTLGVPTDKKIQLIVGTSEETDWADMRHFVREFPVPAFGFSPDGDFPIFNIEKGYTDIELHFTEPARNRLVALSAGDSPNTIPGKACIQLEGGPSLCFDGVSCHSSTPQNGENGILRLCRELEPRGEFAFARFLEAHFKDSSGRGLGLDDGQPYHEGQDVGTTTAAPTMLWLTPKGAAVNINIRQRFPLQSKEILERFQRIGEEWGFDAVLKESLPPMMVDEGHGHLKIMQQVSEMYGCDNSFRVAEGTSYAKAMRNFVSWGPVFPGDGSGVHQEDERLSLASMVLGTKMYASYLLRAATGWEKQERLSSMSSLEKGLFLLELFQEPPHRFTLSEVVSLTGMNRTTAYRNLATLENRGYLARDPGGKSYRLGPANYMLGNLYLYSGNYVERIYNLLEEIAEITRESVGMARRDGDKVMSIYSVEAHQSIKMNDRPGTFYPMNKGTYGKCLMAYHDEEEVAPMLERQRFEKTAPNTLTDKDEILAEYKKIREQGYVLSVEETLSYVIGVGVPLAGKDKRVHNVVAVSFFKQEDYLAKIESIKKVLLEYKPRLEELIR